MSKKLFMKDIEILFNKLNIPIKDISPIDKGINSIVYRIASNNEIYGLKICQYPERKNKVIKEVSLRSDFISKGWDFIPKSIYVDTEIFKNSAVIYKFIDGNKPDFSNPNNLMQLAKYLSLIHQNNLEILPDGFSEAMKNYQALEELVNKSISKYSYLINEELKRSLISALREIRTILFNKKHYFTIGLRSRLHGDLSNNFIIDGNTKLWLIDWENSIISDTLEEIFFFMYINLNREQENIFLSYYKRFFKPAEDIDFLNICETYYSLYPLYYICWNLNFIDTYIKNNIRFNEKYLDLIQAGELSKKFLSKELSERILLAIKTCPIAKMI